MFEPFHHSIIINKIPVVTSPTALLVHSDQLFLGSQDGSLYIYSINLDKHQESHTKHDDTQHSGSHRSPSPTSLLHQPSRPKPSSWVDLILIKSFINFSHKRSTTNSNQPSPSIDSLNLIKEINSLVILSAGNVNLYDLNQFKLQSSSERWTKSQASSICLQTSILRQNKQGVILDPSLLGVTLPAVAPNPSQPTPIESKVQIEPDSIQPTPSSSSSHQPDDIPVLITLLAVPCKRRLILFCWKDGEWLEPKEINLPHQVRSLAFATTLKLFLGYSTGDYATIRLNLPSRHQDPINHEISDPFPSPIVHLINRTAADSPSPLGIPSNPTPKVTGLSSLALKTSGLVSLGLAGSPKVAKNSVIKIGAPTLEVLGVKGQIATFLTYDGKLSRSQTVQSGPHSIPSSIIYPAQPSETIVRPPYVLSLLPSSSTNPSASKLMVHSIPTLSHLQTLQFTRLGNSDLPLKTAESGQPPPGKRSSEPTVNNRLPNRHLLTSSQSLGLTFLIASKWNEADGTMQHDLECLQIKPWTDQIHQLIELGEYEESLALMGGLDEITLPKKAALLAKLNGLCAVINFSKHKYDQAIDSFISLSVNPAKVIALYPAEISGPFARGRDEWEALYGGRSVESYLSTALGAHTQSSSVMNHAGSRPGSDVGSKPSSLSHHAHNPNPSSPKTALEDDRRSIFSGRSPAPAKVKGTGANGVQKPSVEDSSQDSRFRASVEVLMRYLTDRRQLVNKAFAKLNNEAKGGQSFEASTRDETFKSSDCLQPSEELFQLGDRPIIEIDSMRELVQIAKIIDTSLFKCYLAIRPTMLGPLCRLPNWCEVDQVESLLMDAKRYHELLDLYHGKGQHDKALKLLKKMAMNEEDISVQIEPTIRYLQKLGSNHIDLILETSKWVFSRCEGSTELIKEALEIFVADLSAVESLPQPKIVKFLEGLSPIGCQFYLEHLIHNLMDQSSEVHEKLVHLYIIEFKRLRALGLLGSANEVYTKLLDHLRDSSSYSPNWVLGRLPQDDMFEARALTLGNMGQHDAALNIYVYRLRNTSAAEGYCSRVFMKSPESDGSVFLSLLKIYLRPPSSVIDGSAPTMDRKTSVESDPVGEEGGQSTLPHQDASIGNHHSTLADLTTTTAAATTTRKEGLNTQDLLDAGLKLINDHGHKIKGIDEVIECLPSLVGLKELERFIRKSFTKLLADRHQLQLFKFSLQSRSHFLELGLHSLQHRSVKVDLKRLCIGCGKRLGNSVIAVHPPYGEVTHYQCQDRLHHRHLRRL